MERERSENRREEKRREENRSELERRKFATQKEEKRNTRRDTIEYLACEKKKKVGVATSEAIFFLFFF